MGRSEGIGYLNTEPPDRPRLLAVLPDQQIPYHDQELHRVVLRWLRQNQPDVLVLSGDFLDLTSLGTHRKDVRPRPGLPGRTELRDGLAVGVAVLGDYAAAAPRAVRLFVPGNHEQRLEAYILRNAEDLGGLLTLRQLLRLDELGYSWVGAPNGYGPAYPHGQAIITPKLAVRHGWLARSGAGATALKTLETLGYSIIVGHTHRQAIVHKTYHEIDGRLRTLQAVEAGTQAMVRGGLGYAVAPDWTPGFATAWLWPDGTFKTELATWITRGESRVLLWGDQQHRADDSREEQRVG